jgi:hypothetical protein
MGWPRRRGVSRAHGGVDGERDEQGTTNKVYNFTES